MYMSKLFWTIININQICLVQSNTKHAWKYRFPENMGNGSQWWAYRCGTAREAWHHLLKTTVIVATSSFCKWYSLPNRRKVFGKRQKKYWYFRLDSIKNYFLKYMMPIPERQELFFVRWFFVVRWYFKLGNDARLFRFALKLDVGTAFVVIA